MMDKLEVARRQLGTGLALHLREQDPVSAHCLICAGCEIAERLSIEAGNKPLRDFVIESYPGLTVKEHKKIRDEYWNAFKHAQGLGGSGLRDDRELLERFSADENEVRLFVGWFDYGLAAGSMPIEAQVFTTWYLARTPEKFAPDVAPKAIAGFEKVFPGLPSMPRAQQWKRLHRAIHSWRKRPESKSEKTDPRPLILS